MLARATGFTRFGSLEPVAPNGRVTAVDVDPNRVAKLRRQLASERIKNADERFLAHSHPNTKVESG